MPPHEYVVSNLDPALVFGSSSNVTGLDLLTGKIVWTVTDPFLNSGSSSIQLTNDLDVYSWWTMSWSRGENVSDPYTMEAMAARYDVRTGQRMAITPVLEDRYKGSVSYNMRTASWYFLPDPQYIVLQLFSKWIVYDSMTLKEVSSGAFPIDTYYPKGDKPERISIYDIHFHTVLTSLLLSDSFLLPMCMLHL